MAELVQPVLIKDGGLFLCCQGDGDIVTDCGSGLGLFHRDTRYLSRYELRLGDAPGLTLMTSAARGRQSVHEMANTAIRQLDGSPLELQSFGARLERVVDGEALTLSDRLILRNYTPEPISFRVTILIDALFEDLFELRGAKAKKRGPSRRLIPTSSGLAFRYDGADGVVRRLDVVFSRPPRLSRHRGACLAAFDIRLGAQASDSLDIVFAVCEADSPAPCPAPRPAFYDGLSARSDNPILDRVMQRSLRDLTLLGTSLEASFIAGGMPWFVAPFGRDSILAALQTLPFDARPAEGVARLFCAYQGAHDVKRTGEQPGKTLHELRLGAMARLKEVPHDPSYMSVDSTPLFLILIGQHAEWTGELALFNALRPAIDGALDWMARETRDDGYLKYSGQTPAGPINQGWKDSTSGVPRKDGGVPRPPIALCEVQGYVYQARVSIAAVLRRAGEPKKAEGLEADAAALKQQFNRDFWMEDEGCYALALERGGKQVTVVTSNAGQVLWSGIAEADKAARTAERLTRPDMDSGWGVRTLSAREKSYNPLNYHLGSVWPFDNALIVAGLRRYGFDEAAVKLVDALVDAASHFTLGRLPEFYVGFQREPDLTPARCPFAEPLQAWSAGAMPYMVSALLGLHRKDGDLAFERPLLPGGVSRLALCGLSVGAERFDCEIVRQPSGAITAKSRPARDPKS